MANILTFKKKDGKWQPLIDGKLAFKFYSEYGYPPEMLEEMFKEKMEKVGFHKRVVFFFNEFYLFCKENNLNLKEELNENA